MYNQRVRKRNGNTQALCGWSEKSKTKGRILILKMHIRARETNAATKFLTSSQSCIFDSSKTETN